MAAGRYFEFCNCQFVRLQLESPNLICFFTICIATIYAVLYCTLQIKSAIWQSAAILNFLSVNNFKYLSARITKLAKQYW